MKTALCAALALWTSAVASQAAVIQDWSKVQDWTKTQGSDKTMGSYAGSYTGASGTADLSQAPGPDGSDKAAKIFCDLPDKGWGGIWVNSPVDLSKSGLRFMAKAGSVVALRVCIEDGRKVDYVSDITLDGTWREYVLPIRHFRHTEFSQDEGLALDAKHVVGMVFSPGTGGASTVFIGPVSTCPAGATAQVGIKNGMPTVQDFSNIGSADYGSFGDDNGSSVDFSTEKNPDEAGKSMGVIRYDLKHKGWCGIWVRTGDAWGGQDWTGAKSLKCRVYSTEPLLLEFGFNDANEGAYIADAPMTKGGGWETLQIPFSAFALNPAYQPPQAVKGAKQDLTAIDGINVAVETVGIHVFKMADIEIGK